MIIGGLFVRGSLCILIGVLYLLLGYIFYGYYKKNTLVTSENEYSIGILGTNTSLGLLMAIYIFTFVLHLVMSGLYLSSINYDVNMSKLISEACPKKKSLLKDILKKSQK